MTQSLRSIDTAVDGAPHGPHVILRVLPAVGVSADGGREVLGLNLVSGEDGPGWLAFLRSLLARRPSGSRWSAPTRMPGWPSRSADATR